MDDQTILAGLADCSIVKIKLAASGSIVSRWTGHSGSVIALTLLDNGCRILSGSWDKTLKLWSGDGSCLSTLTGHKNSVTCLSLPPSSPLSTSHHQLAVTGSGNCTLIIWDLNDKKSIMIFTGHQRGLFARY